MTTRTLPISLVALLLAPSPALANAPDHMQFLAIPGVLVIALVILTIAGGGYKIIWRLEEEKLKAKGKEGSPTSKNNYYVGLIIAFMAVVSEAGAVIALLCVIIYSIVRGGNMMVWGKKARSGGGAGEDTPRHLLGADPERLTASGVILIIITLAVPAAFIPTLGESDFGQLSAYRARAYRSELHSEAKGAHAAAMVFLSENPEGTVDSLEKLKEGGYVISDNSSFVFGDMTEESGAIVLQSSKLKKLGDESTEAVIDHTGKITYR